MRGPASLDVPARRRARLCADCAGVAPLARCSTCGIEDRLYHNGRCVHCALAERAARLLCGPRPELVAVYDAIVAARQPYSAHNWFRSAVAASILSEIASGALPLTHEALDAHPHPRAAGFLRQLLVAHGSAARPRRSPDRPRSLGVTSVSAVSTIPPSVACYVPTPPGGCCAEPGHEPPAHPGRAPLPATPRRTCLPPLPFSPGSADAGCNSATSARPTSTPGRSKAAPRPTSSTISWTGQSGTSFSLLWS